MQRNLFDVAMAAYTPEEYRKIQAISEDVDAMEPTWTEWRQTANQAKIQLAMKGKKSVEKLIDTEGLLKYCLENGIRVDHAARASYAQWLYEKDGAEIEEEEPLTTRIHSYTPPVDQLLTYTSIKDDNPLPEISYIEKFGLGPEHIPELIRMATDDYLGSEDTSNFEFAAPLHAVSVLAELHAESAIDPLLNLYDNASRNENEWMLETLIDVYTIIGPAALPSLEQFLADPSHEESAQNYVSDIIGRIANKYPEARTECIAIATRRLEEFEINDPDLNAGLISSLLTMKAVETAPLIQRALASNRVEEDICGDWDEVQYDLGLKERPARKARFNSLSAPVTPTRSRPDSPSVLTHKSTKKSSSSKKAKTKLAKASKKTNRRKK